MGKTTEISWLHYFVPESRFPAGRSLPKRVWLEHEPTTRLVKVLGATFNPWIGCAPAVHPSGVAASGCNACYAAALNERFKWAHKLDKDGKKVPAWGKGAPRKLSADSTWKQALGWARDAAGLGLRRRWFFSLGDPLDPEVPEEWRAKLWDFIRETTHVCRHGCSYGHCDNDSRCYRRHQLCPVRGGLDAYLLTKRPWLWEVIPEDVRPLIRLGTSASDQESWDLWVSDLVRAQGFAGLFVSLEPQVEAVDVSGILPPRGTVSLDASGYEFDTPRSPLLSLVIVGGESGPKARPFRLEWARSVRDQCRAAGVRWYFKQAGSNPKTSYYDESTREQYEQEGWDWPRPEGWHERDGQPMLGAMVRLKYLDPAGADPSEWPEDLRVQEVP